MPDPDFDREVDLLVAGAGAGGMTAAVVANASGLDVLVCEKSTLVGGTASTSAGSLWIPGNRQSIAAGFVDSAEEASRYMDALVPRGVNKLLRDAYFRSGPEAIDFLEANSEVRFIPCGRHPDYKSNLPGAAVSGRAVVPEDFDGRLLGPEFERVRPPIPEFMILGGMMAGKADIPHLLSRFRSVSSFLYSARLFVRFLMDRLQYSRGTRLVMGNALVARLYFSLLRRKIPVHFSSAITELIVSRGAVLGAVVNADGKSTRIRARRGVVLATGGYAHNTDFRKAFMPVPTPEHSLAAPSNEGDGIRLGRGANARIAPKEHGTGAFWTPTSITHRADGTTGLYPHLSLDRAKPGLVAVNSAGRRFVNEADSYHDFVEAMFACHRTTPCIPAYLICEAHFVRKYGLGAIYPGTSSLKSFEKSGYITVAPTIAELADRIGVDRVGLEDTIRRNNHNADSGVDVDFGKGETELNRFNGDPGNKPNPCMAPIQQGPFCAMAVWPAEIACSTGLSTDEDARVLNVDGDIIPGLFACGNDMASIMAGTYPGPGTTIGPAVVFGYRAARAASASAERRLSDPMPD